MHFNSPPIKREMPVVVIIKNNSDDKHYNVKVFDYDHERQDKITYESGIKEISYNDILKKLSSLKENELTCGIIYITTHAGYEKFKRKQLFTTIYLKHTSLDGSITKVPIIPASDPYQQQLDIIVVDKIFLFDKTLQVEIESLLPETELHLRFYLQSQEIKTDTVKEVAPIHSPISKVEAIKKIGKKVTAKKPVKSK